MIRFVFIITLAIFAHFSANAQERPTRDANQPSTLKANPERDKAAYVATLSPNITMNGTDCKFKDISVIRSTAGQYTVRVRFEESCAGFTEASFYFTDLKEALEVKELFLNYRSFQSLNITGKKGETLAFEVIFNHPGRR
jgi:hypothetical protein